MEMRAPILTQNFDPFLQGLELCEEPFRLRLLRELKKELLLLLPEWGLAPSREDYFLHQLTQSWSLENLLGLVTEINARHLNQCPHGQYAHLETSSGAPRFELRLLPREDLH